MSSTNVVTYLLWSLDWRFSYIGMSITHSKSESGSGFSSYSTPQIAAMTLGTVAPMHIHAKPLQISTGISMRQ